MGTLIAPPVYQPLSLPLTTHKCQNQVAICVYSFTRQQIIKDWKENNMRILLGIFILLHGLVHLWFVTLSRGWVKFQADMGWTGHSWLLTNIFGNGPTSLLATVSYAVAAITFVIASIGLLANQQWTRPWMIAASVISAATILVFWDGKFPMIVEKGIIGFMISAGILVAIFFLGWLS
jgi:hypothetical protein